MPAAGRLNQKATFQRRTGDTDSESAYVEDWTDIATRWVGIEPLNGNEYFAQFGENNRMSVRIRVRYDSALATLNSGDRVVANGVAYDIVAPINDKMLNREWILGCETGYAVHE